LPPEEPAGQNPPDGAIINYYFATIRRRLSRSRSSTARINSFVVFRVTTNQCLLTRLIMQCRNTGFVRRKCSLRKPGMQRFVWDLKYAPPAAFGRGFPISAIYRDTPLYPLGPSVLPGTFYTVKLTANGRHVHTTVDGEDGSACEDAGCRSLTQQFNLSLEAYRGMQKTFDTSSRSESCALRSGAIERAGSWSTGRSVERAR
jgi:hypothetical protein